MARKVVKTQSTSHGKIGMAMTALAALSAFGLFRNRNRRAGLLAGVGKIGTAAAGILAASEVLMPQTFARAMARPQRSRFSTWFAR